MPNKRDLALWNYSISKERYRYLNYFCRQYDDWQKRIKDVHGLNAISYDGMPHGNKLSNPVEAQAFQTLKYIKAVSLVEQTCREADAGIWKQLLRNVTDGVTYEYLDVPCGRNRFYNSRRKFYYMLDLKLP